MSVSIWLLTSACAVGAATDVPVVQGRPMVVQTAAGQQVIYTQAPMQQVVYTEADPQMMPTTVETEPKRGLLSGLKDLFYRDSPPRATTFSTNRPMVVQQAPGQMVPMQGQVIATSVPMPASNGIVQVGAQQMMTMNGQAAPVDVRREFQNKVGHAEDYRWVTGQLFFLASDNLWAVRFTSPNEPEQFGGCAVLAPGLEMGNAKDGDLVSVNGQVIPNVQGSRTVNSCFYKATNITPLERVASTPIKQAK